MNERGKDNFTFPCSAGTRNHCDEYGRHLANTIEVFVFGGNAAGCRYHYCSNLYCTNIWLPVSYLDKL